MNYLGNKLTRRVNKGVCNLFVVLFIGTIYSAAAYGLTALTDSEMAKISGQASLLNIDKYDYAGNNFYQVKFNASVQTSINIDKLELRDGSGNLQLDIDHLSINGGDTSNGNAAVSSATITNPFIEFAFAGSIGTDNSRNREIIGIRIGSDDIEGFMSFGNQADETGINKFRGYMKTGPISGTATTLDSSATTDPATWATANNTVLENVTGTRGPLPITGLLDVNYDYASPFFCTFDAAVCAVHLAIDVGINPGALDATVDLKYPALVAPFSLPGGVEINAVTPIDKFPLITAIAAPALDFEASGSGTVDVLGFIPIGVNLVSTGTVTSGLVLDATVNQELSYIHRAELVSGGDNTAFSLSAQNRNLQWRGAPTNDVAQAGWWMSVGNPVQLGALAIEDVYLPDATLLGINNVLSQYLTDNPVQIGSTAALAGIGGVTSSPLGNIALPSSAPAVSLVLGSQSLGLQQQEIRNCWNGNIGC